MKQATQHPALNLGIALAFLLALTGCGSIARTLVFNHPAAKKIFTPPRPDYTLTGRGWTNSIGNGTNTITVLHVTGDNFYSLGYYQGKLLGPQVAATIADVLAAAPRMLPREVRKATSHRVQQQLAAEALDKAWKMMEPFTPQEDLEEMAGLADGLKAAGITGIDLATLHRVHSIPDLSETSCSALVARGAATPDNHVYQLRILDYGGEFGLEKRPLITVYHAVRTNQNAFINIGWIGFIGVISGMNEKGVALSEMGYGNPPGETLCGEPMPFLLKQVLRNANTAEEAACLIRAARRNNSYAYWIGDRGGGAIGMVTCAKDCQMFRVNECTEVWDRQIRLPQFPDVIYAGHVSEKQGRVVQAMHGHLDVPHIQDMAKQIAMDSNLHTVIYDLTDRTVWVANRHGSHRAADCSYVQFPYAEWNTTETGGSAVSTTAPERSPSPVPKGRGPG